MGESPALLIRGGHVLTMDPARGDLPEADVLVRGTSIAAIGPSVTDPGATLIDARGCLVLPGFVDSHRHMWQAVLRGGGPQFTLADYFDHVLVRAAARLTSADMYTGNLLSALAALDGGITTVQDVSNVQRDRADTEALVGALTDSGARAVFCYGHGYAQGGDLPRPHGGLSPDARRLRTEVLHDDTALVTMALSGDHGGADATRWNWRLAEELDLPVTMHMNAAASQRPISRLAKLGVLRPGTTFIHGNRLDPAELRVVADTGGSLSVAPAIETMMGHGLPQLAAAVGAGLTPTLSTDVEVSGPGDMFSQMRAAYQFGRFAELQGLAPGAAPTVRDIVRYATEAGARALGLAGRIGSLTPGRQADLQILRTDRPGVAPVHDPYATLVLAMDRSDVDMVLVAGRVVKSDGRLTYAGLPALVDDARAVRDRLLEGPDAR